MAESNKHEETSSLKQRKQRRFFICLAVVGFVALLTPLVLIIATRPTTAAYLVTTAPTNTTAPINTTAPTNTTAPINTTAPTNTTAPINTTAPTNTTAESEEIVACKNGGFCIKVQGNCTCLCTPAFTGENCETAKNLALNRPASQSSTYFWSDEFLKASLAVDGNDSPSLNPGMQHCSQTNDGDRSNWLMVDLGELFSISSVVLTNRDTAANRLDYFIVGVTNTSSEDSAPVRGSYPLCGQYHTTAPPAARLVQFCSADTPPARYVIIQQPENGPGYLTICELEVYAN